MAPSPGIPTSFVPKQPVATGPSPRYTRSGGNLFMMIASLVLGLSVVAGIGVFAYERYLSGVRDSKQAEVEQVRENINSEVVEDFIRTRDRFSAAQGLLNEHVAASQFFDLLEALTLQNVRFSGLSFTLSDDRSAKIHMDGTARSFNALAAESSAFASEKRIKRAIFSDITVDPATRNVSFSLDAELAPALLTLSTAATPAFVPAATTTQVTPTATSTATSSAPNPLSL